MHQTRPAADARPVLCRCLCPVAGGTAWPSCLAAPPPSSAAACPAAARCPAATTPAPCPATLSQCAPALPIGLGFRVQGLPACHPVFHPCDRASVFGPMLAPGNQGHLLPVTKAYGTRSCFVHSYIGKAPILQDVCEDGTSAACQPCGLSCRKERACGHACPLACHSGACPPCQEQVALGCHCARTTLTVVCHTLDRVRSWIPAMLPSAKAPIMSAHQILGRLRSASCRSDGFRLKLVWEGL